MRFLIVMALFFGGMVSSAYACITMPEQVDAAFATADMNQDKTLSSDEYFRAFKDPVPTEGRPAIFRGLDKNQDGVLSRQEFDTQAGSAHATDMLRAPPTLSMEPSVAKGSTQASSSQTQGCGLSQLK